MPLAGATAAPWSGLVGSSPAASPEIGILMTPLVFGTLKATFYSLLFGLPLAILAAIVIPQFTDASTQSKLSSCLSTRKLDGTTPDA